MATVRAKFKCECVTNYEHGKEAKLSAVTTGSEENEAFWKYTPCGDVRMLINNPPASEMFEPGKEYYLDFTPAE